MNKIVKKLSVICLGLMLLTGCTPKNNEEPNTSNKQVSIDERVNEVVNYANLKETASAVKSSELTTFKYADVSFTLKATVERNINASELSGIQQYNFKIEIPAENNYKFVMEYNGIILDDLIEKYDITEYSTVVFKTENGSTLTVPASLASTALIVFQAEGKDLNEWGPVKVIVPTYEKETWLETVTSIEFK